MNKEKLIQYLGFKMDCLREQEEFPLTVDLDKAKDNLDRLSVLQKEREDQLLEIMPNVPVIAKRARPKQETKADGSHTKKFQFLHSTLMSRLLCSCFHVRPFLYNRRPKGPL